MRKSKTSIRPRRKVIILMDNSRQWNRDIMMGIAQYAKLQGSWTIYRKPPFYRMPFQSNKKAPVLINKAADGIIMGGNDYPDIPELEIPVVTIVTRDAMKHYTGVTSDSKKLGTMAADYFMNVGLREFAYCGFDDIEWSRIREESFCKTIEKYGKTVHRFESPISMSIAAWQKEKRMITRWLLSLPKPIGLFACNDDCGQFILETCSDSNIKVPDEVAVLGVDNDTMICELTDPPLSSIALNTEKAGYRAAAKLDKLMNREKVKKESIIVTPSHVVSRQSTELLAIDDPKITQAIRFIHNNASQPMQIDDIANAVALSRRSLTKRFRQIMGRSVYDEIRRIRADRIAQLLLETDLPIHQIAYDMGFTTSKHISRFFKNEKGITPSEYRNQHLS